MRERVIRLNHALPFSQPIVRSHNHRYLRSQANGFAHIRGVVITLLFRIVKAQRRNRGPQNIHRARTLRDTPQELDYRRI